MTTTTLSSNEKIILTQSNGIATLILNRPQIKNALDQEMITTLIKQIHQIQHDDRIQILILKGMGSDFCAGADLHWMKESIQYKKEENRQDALNLAKLFSILYHCTKPILAVVQGAVFGGAVGLISCCDIVLAEPESEFCFSEVKLGLIPAVISPYVLRIIGERNAKRYMITAEIMSASIAVELGLVQEIVMYEEMESRLNYFIEKIQNNSPNAIKATKSMIQHLVEAKTSNSIMEYTAELISDIRISSEAKEGINAFLEKRKPNWQKHYVS